MGTWITHPNLVLRPQFAIQNYAPAVIVAATVSLSKTAPIGYPFASGLAIVTISGWQSTGSTECAQSVPVLYSPHYTLPVSFML